jgi:hypothetical protein
LFQLFFFTLWGIYNARDVGKRYRNLGFFFGIIAVIFVAINEFWLPQINHSQNVQSKQMIESSSNDTSLNSKKPLNKNNAQNNLDKINLRAYVVLNDIEGFDLHVGQRIQGAIKFMNTGKTPAHNLMPSRGMCTGDQNLDSCINFLRGVADRHKNEGDVLGANMMISTAGICAPNPISIEDSIQTYIMRRPFYVYGIISYYDIFKERHLTYFCRQIDIPNARVIVYSKYNFAN